MDIIPEMTEKAIKVSDRLELVLWMHHNHIKTLTLRACISLFDAMVTLEEARIGPDDLEK